MAVLEQLSLGGVRSFGADDSENQFLNFDVPFTLILGRNGCGKTTVIEALKYACTGTMPHGQGGNFVRDPKLDRKIETMAQVKLLFRSCEGKEALISRSMSVTQKAKNLQFKTLDTSIRLNPKEKDSKDLSGRCVDIDEIMSHLLGVAKPILNYVIFCHQEDSHWPLEEGKKVKEKFDEIFDSTKYNKCMVKVREMRNKVMIAIREINVEIKHLETNVEAVRNKRGEIERITQRYNETKGRKEEFEQKIRACQEEYETWESKYRNYRIIEKEKDRAQLELDKCLDHQKDLEGLITHKFIGTEDELIAAIKSFDGQLDEKKRAHEHTEKEIDNFKRQEKSILADLSIVQNKIGMLKAELKRKQELIGKRNSELSCLAKAFGLPVLSEEATEVEVTDLHSKVKKELNKSVNHISSLKRKYDEEQNNLQDNINKCFEGKNKLEAEIKVKKDTITNNDGDVLSLKNKLKEVSRNVERKRRIDEDLDKCRQEHERALKTEDLQVLSTQIEDLKSVCKQLEGRQKELTDEVRTLTKYQDVQKDLQRCEEKSSETQNAIRRLHSKNADFIERHLKNSSDGTIKFDLEMIMQKFKKEIEQTKQELHGKKLEVSSLEKDREHKKHQLKIKEDECAANEEALFKLCGKRDLQDVLDSVDGEIKKVQDDKGMYASIGVVYNHFIKEIKRLDSCCPLCHREFDSENESSEILVEIEAKVKNVPNNFNELNDTISKLHEKQRKLLLLKPVQSITKNLKSIEIPKLRKEIEAIEESLDAAFQEDAFLEANLKNPQDSLRNAEMAQSDVYDIDRLHKDSKQLSRQIEKLKRDLPSNSKSRTFDEALAEQQVVQDELCARRSEKDEAEKRQQDYMNRINVLEQKINKYVAEQLRIQELVQQEENTKERLNELVALGNALETEIQDLNQSLQPALEKHKEAVNVLEDAKKQHRIDIQAREKQREERSSEMASVENLQISIRQLMDRNLSEDLEEKSSKLAQLEQKIHDLRVERETLDKESKTLSADIEGHKQRGKELNTNLTLIQKRSEGVQLKENLKQVQKKLGNLDFKGMSVKMDEIAQKINELSSKKNEHLGILQGLEDSIDSHKRDLNFDHLKNAEKNYTEKLISLTVQKHVEKDLQKYYSAIDYAMLHFHKDRMNSINTIIRELWRLIYKGNDIDYIEIKTDDATPSTATSATDKKRVYNYRVVQVKNGTEIEMRGRCSAGQKVLASLIIRMALSETFSANCGILTLDEPTTNLDKQNINSLSHAITEIVHDHLGRKNFQLIVITHDQDFLQTMSHADFFSHYWEVTRNHQSKSCIKRKDLDG